MLGDEYTWSLPAQNYRDITVPVPIPHSLPYGTYYVGWIIDPDKRGELAQVVRRLLVDPAATHEMVERGRSHVSQFTWERCARQTYEVYERVV